MLIYRLFTSTELVIPFSQAFIYISMISGFMLFRRLKYALITTFLFTLYWGFVLNKDAFVSKLGEAQFALYIYGVCGFVVLVLTIYSFFFNE